jgi:aspartyl-tRNA(Asn)/glutamyl-tRNA(Gln) amidotransferase subunit B
MNSTPYTVVIGLEVHVQLKTKSKLFCRCSTEFGQPPNTQVCPVCLGLPGALPVLNRKAIEYAIRTGLALNSQIASFTKWDRKNYFYPDLPKGYQTSQFDLPICSRGFLDISDSKGAFEPKRIRFVRAHLEEDAGKSMHDEKAGKADSRIDLNRAGTPLLEIVTEPDLRSPQEARAFLTELRLLLLYLDVSDCNMQEGSLRCDANVNLHIPVEGKVVATPITEIKNLNSFRAVERAVAYESTRQWDQWKADGVALGQRPKQTRGWDDVQGVTILQREKEESSDYRYFPCPDLVPVILSQADLAEAQTALCELPAALRSRLVQQYELKDYDSDVIVSQGKAIVDYFEQAVAKGGPAKRVSSWIQQDILRLLNERQQSLTELGFSAERLADLTKAIEAGVVDTSRGKEVFAKILDQPALSVQAAIEALGIKSVGEDELMALCRQLLADNPKVIVEYRGGNAKALAPLIGQAKKKNANADPRKVQEICKQLIDSGAV